jgi:surface protein
MYNPAEIDKLSMRNGAAATHTVAMGNLLSTDQSTLYLDASSGFDASRPITVFTVVTTRLGNAVTFKELGPSAILSNFTVPQNIFGDAPFVLTAPTTNSDGAFTYSSSNLAVATVSGSTVTIVGAGSTTITATQAATASYGSNSISTTLDTTPPPPVLSLTGNTIKYIGDPTDVPTTSTLFVKANVRGTNEWFAVVKDGMKDAISAYASGTNGPFIPIGQTVPVPFNNIVTTLMTDFLITFFGKSSFNQPISSWDTSNVTRMISMFMNAQSFNQPIGSWNTAKVTDIYNMFYNAQLFNQPIGSWNTAKVPDMSQMFHGATMFNQDISGWNVALVTNFASFRTSSALTVANMPAAFYPAASLSGFSVPSKTFGDAPFALTAPTSNSDGAFTYSSSNPAVATVSGSTVTIVGAGTTTITATQAATFNYNTNSITASFVVSKATPSLSNFSVASKTFGDAPFALTAPTSNSDGAFTYSSSNETVATVSGSTVTIVSAGSATITATQAATFNYNTNSITASLVVTPPVLSLTGNTINYIGNSANVPSSSALFVQTDVRGTGVEWFAVVKDGMKSAITSYAKGDSSAPFIPSGQTVPVPFNNIVTTLMTNMYELFLLAGGFNQPIASWDTANVTNMSGTFKITPFNQPIDSWNTAKVRNMAFMFNASNVFNQVIGSWNTSNVSDMNYMFSNSTKFNQPINYNSATNAWNIANVKTMDGMFIGTTLFNQSISAWNTANVTKMNFMFENATVFNQDISSWNVALVTPVPPTDFRKNSALVDANMPAAFLP